MMNDYILLKKSDSDKYYINDDSNFLQEFNIIFNKIPHIYASVFLSVFGKYYRYIPSFINKDNAISFNITLKRTFNSYNHLNYKFYYYYLNNDFKNKVINKKFDIIQDMSNILKSDIDACLLMDIIDNRYYSYYKYFSKYDVSFEDKLYLYQIFINYLISKLMVRIIQILNIYNRQFNNEFYYYINKVVDKYRTVEMDMSNVLDSYDYKYKNILNKSEYKILIYLLCLSKNGKYLDKECNYNIVKIFASINYSTSLVNITDYIKGSEYLEIVNGYYDNKLFSLPEYPYVYKNVRIILRILFDKYHDEYEFLINKDNILKKIFYLYIKNINLIDKINVCYQYCLWEYEWDSIKEKYEICYNNE